MEVDPVCGMEVEPRETTGSYALDGHKYFFCSTYCLDAFKQSPGKYVGEQPKASAGHYAAVAAKPRVAHGADPRMPLPSPSPSGSAVEYTCPMHPEIVRPEPGSCPICGMNLEPRMPAAAEDNRELADMKRRFWASAIITAFLVIAGMSDLAFPETVERFISPKALAWAEFLLATPVIMR